MADNYNFSELNGARMQDKFSAYLDKGWALVPVDSDTRKRIETESGDKTARDLNMAMEWNDSDFGVAIATGRDSGIVALRYLNDIGKSTLEALQSDRGEQLATLSVRLHPRGNALLFRAPETKLRSVKDFAPGLDLLAENAYFSPAIWDAGCSDLADLPDFLLSLVTGQSTFGYADLAAGGNLAVLNNLTSAEAAQAYHELGLEMIAVDEKGQRLTEEGTFASPELWQNNPGMGIAIVTGSTSGIVGLWAQDERSQALSEKIGSLTLPQIRGRQTVACFSAPSERFPSKVLFDDIMYIGENDLLPLPPSVVNGSRLRWQVAKDVLPELPDLMPRLRRLLTNPEALVTVKTNTPLQPQQQQSSQGKEMGPAALRYGTDGWAVFPLWTGGKTPKTKNGLKAATFDLEQINKWWKRYKDANVAVRTGMISGIVVLDVDTKKGQPGLQSLAELEAQHGRMDTLRARTPTGGLHLFFRAPMQTLHRKIGFLPGLDFLAEDSYVVVAPSKIGGREYVWEDTNTMIAEIPDFLLNLVSAKVSKKTQNTAKPHETISYAEAFGGVQEGSRNDTIFRFACKLRQEEWEHDEALLLVKTAASTCEPPLPEDEAIRCLESAWRYTPSVALSDMGNAERFVARCGDNVRYIRKKTAGWCGQVIGGKQTSVQCTAWQEAPSSH